ncbi:rhombosortase [Vibrio sp. qd031]|uniref:rhombosortase n=1 Tax=Vibrio sp. qd031 TaxID=1603038 RepID=UPI001F5B87DB|nr:rhombosortase [Vibrio sp. qd031]
MFTISGHRALYLLLLVVTLLLALIQAMHLEPLLVWDRLAISNGEYWRIVTGNWLHTNWNHFFMNAAGFVFIALIFTPPARIYLIATLTLTPLVGFCLINSDYQQYAGLSGVLHGLFGWFALREALNGRRSSWLLVGGLVLKVGYETLFNPESPTQALIDAPIAFEAHLYGALLGLTIALIRDQTRL